MQNYIQNGEEIFLKYCNSPDNLHPTMLPIAPDQTYIDKYPQSSPDFGDERKRQSDYEAEVVVYRAVEKLDEKRVVVLHNFEYTHHQYRLCDKDHVRKGCPECKKPKREGECDFLVICPDRFIIIEVKNMTNFDEYRENPECMTMKKHSEVLNKTFKKSLQQRHKIVNLIECLDKDIPILQFTACPNFSAKYREEFADQPGTNSIIFKEDLDNFSAWWMENVINNPLIPDPGVNLPNNCEKVRNTLLALWCTGKNDCDQSRCSLGQSILNISKRLKEGKFTFVPKQGKNRAQNPGVIEAPDVIRNYVQVENLTVEQCEAFNSTEKMLWINGPAGTGKSVILCGRIIQLVQSDDDNKVVLFKFGGDGNNCQLYQCALKEAGVEYQETSTRDLTAEELVTLIISESNCKVIIVKITREDVQKLTDTISAVTNCHIFIDDVQELLNICAFEMDSVTVLMDKLLLSECSVRVACDFAQGYFYMSGEQFIGMARVITDKLSSSQLVTLSMNLRNTCDIFNILCVIREQIRELHLHRTNVYDMILPVQSPGHFIHGPLPVIHVFNDYNVNGMIRVLNIELDSLYVTDNLNYSDIGIVVDVTSSVMSLVRDSVNMRCVNTGSKIAVCRSKYCASSEWPAVIVLHEVYVFGNTKAQDLNRLYSMLSRARVYCSVVIYPEEGDTLSYTPDMSRLLDNLSNFARIIRY